MNFQKAKTSEKLNFLASVLKTDKVAKIFDQSSPRQCVVSLGNRLTSRGAISKTSYDEGFFIAYLANKFANKFGVSTNEVLDLFFANYGGLGIGLRSMRDYSKVTNNIAARAVEKLAAKYAKQGK